MIKFVYYCGGCDAKAESGHVRQTFRSFSGRDYGFGQYHVIADPEKDAPEGWIAFDLIGATYCPTCAESLCAEIAALNAEQQP